MNQSNRDQGAYVDWIRFICDVHRSQAWNAGRTPEQEAEEDRLNELWEDLDERQQQRLWGLSADLNTLCDQEVVVSSDWPSLSEIALRQELNEALSQGEWDRALELLRRPPQVHSRDERDALRGRCWTGLGHADVAEMFMANAERLRISTATAEPKALFKIGASVILRSTHEMGHVEAGPQLDAGEFWYRVRFVKKVENIVEDDLAEISKFEETLESLTSTGRWGRLQALRCALGIERIQHTNRSTIYAFQSQRILFEPYQYKPLLKVLDSPDRRVLIADEVGLGKTIEAGLVLTELSARRPLQRVLIVCPSRLREKWRNELNGKFDQDFEILDKQGFLQAASRSQENPNRFQLRAILSMQSARSSEVREALTSELGHVDLVVVDEAHHARNRNTSTSELLRDLCEVGDCVLLLTATPVHLKNEDLFTLLNALRPAEFRDAYSFDSNLEHHAPVHDASRLARTQSPERLKEISDLLTSVFCGSQDATQHDPKAVQVIHEISHCPPQTRHDWVELERQIQELHPLGSIVTRTRKRDVLENAPERRARTVYCNWTTAEDEAYQRLVGGSGALGWFRSGMSLGQIQRARQAASCLPAAHDRESTVKDDDNSLELTDIPPSELSSLPDDHGRLRDPGAWRGSDSKFAKLEELLTHVWSEEPDAKVLVFTFFRGTARYLEKNLTQKGWLTFRIDGDIPSDPRRPEVDERGKRIRQFQSDRNLKVLVSTEVGSEGLDFQFCHHLVNYDLPWNPMVVEQRIGRVDRFGQESSVVHIHNLVVRGTVEDTILERLYKRIGIFERSIGNLEAILGETISELQRDFVSGRLTPQEAERRVDLAANAIKRKSQDLDQLEKQASELFGHEEFIRDEMNRVRNLGRYISEESIIALLATFFESYHPQARIKRESEHAFCFRMTEELRQEIHDSARGGASWVDRSRGGVLRFTTSGEVAFRRRDLDLVNASHPLVRAAVRKVGPQLESPLARVTQARLSLEICQDSGFHEGVYFFLLFAHSITSIRSRRILETVACEATTGKLLDAELSERLLHLTIERGFEWDRDSAAPSLSPELWERMTSEAKKRNRLLRAAEERENRALYVRRQNALRAEYEHDLMVKQQRLDTARAREKIRILPALQGQIDKAKSGYRAKLEELSKMQDVRASLSEPLAACAVHITP